MKRYVGFALIFSYLVVLLFIGMIWPSEVKQIPSSSLIPPKANIITMAYKFSSFLGLIAGKRYTAQCVDKASPPH